MGTASSTKVTYFNGADENINLIFPLLFIVATFVGFYFGIHFNSIEENLLFIISQFVFLNWIHVLFAPYMMSEYPEVRRWFVDKCQQEPGTLIKWALIWLLLFVASFWMLWAIASENFWLKQAALFLLVLRTMWGTQHIVAQTMGLNISFNIDLQRQSRFLKVARGQQFERFFLRWFLIFFCFNLLIFAFPHFLKPYTVHVKFIGLGAAIVALVALYVNAFTFFEGRMNRKFIFHLRLLLWPLSFFSPIAFCGARSAHGMEYLFTLRKMRKNSMATEKAWNWRLFALLLLPSLFLFLADEQLLGKWVQTQIPHSRMLVLGFWAAGLATLAFHYYLDSVLFRMRDEKTRDAVGPLLVQMKRARSSQFDRTQPFTSASKISGEMFATSQAPNAVAIARISR